MTRLSLVVVALTLSVTPARAGSLLFDAPPINCFGTTRVCYSAPNYSPLAWGYGSFFASFTVSHDARIEGLEFWGGTVSGLTLWDSRCATDICLPVPNQPIATLDVRDQQSTFYAIGEPQSAGTPFYDLSLTLAAPVVVEAGTYYLDFQVAQLLISSRTYVFAGGILQSPGAALAVIGEPMALSASFSSQDRQIQITPEPATLALLGAGLALVAMMRRKA